MPTSSQHDRQIFERWLTEHRGIIVKIVRSFAATEADAEDLTQEIMVALWRSVPSFRGEAKPSTWIWRIALNQALSAQRKTTPVPTDLVETGVVTSSDRVDDGLRLERIYDAIRSQKPIDRSLIMLSLEGYRYDEISEMTGLSETNVGARLSRARTRLTDQLKDAR